MSTQHPNKAEREKLIFHAEKTLAALQALPVLTPCTECMNYDNGNCTKWNAQVPEDARAAGCPSWEEPIPF